MILQAGLSYFSALSPRVAVNMRAFQLISNSESW